MVVEVYDPDPLPLALEPPPGRQFDTICGSYIKSIRDHTIYYLDFNFRAAESPADVATYTREFLLLKHKLLLDEWWRRHTFACRKFPRQYDAGGERTCGEECYLYFWPGVHEQPPAQILWERQASSPYWKFMSQLNLLHSLEISGTPITRITRRDSVSSTELPAAMFDFPHVPGPDNIPEIHDQYTDWGKSFRISKLDHGQDDVIKAWACCSSATIIRPLAAASGATGATTAYENIQKAIGEAGLVRRFAKAHFREVDQG